MYRKSPRLQDYYTKCNILTFKRIVTKAVDRHYHQIAIKPKYKVREID